jgi:hypothetical protein
MSRPIAFRPALTAAMMVALLAGSARAAAPAYTYAPIDVDFIGSINNKGEMAGYNFTETGEEGFVISNGTVTPFPDTAVWGINDRGQVVALSPDGSVLIDRGRSTPINIPDTLFSITLDVNNNGQVCGFAFGELAAFGYVLDTRSGALTVVAHDDAVFGTILLGINDGGEAVGYYVDADWNFIGFHYKDGVFTPVTGPSGEPAYPAAINKLGQIAGDYYDAENHIHSFVLTGGEFTPIEVPGAVPGSVGARGINDRGQVVGYYLDADFNELSFLATPTR